MFVVTLLDLLFFLLLQTMARLLFVFNPHSCELFFDKCECFLRSGVGPRMIIFRFACIKYTLHAGAQVVAHYLLSFEVPEDPLFFKVALLVVRSQFASEHLVTEAE
jgi:hypothetical protein